MLLIDANIALRYILNDNCELSARARDIIDNNPIVIPLEAFCEVVYVLSSVYEIDRKTICTTLTGFIIDTQCISVHKEAVLCALQYFAATKLDFVDCIFAGYAEKENACIETFDMALQKLLQKITANTPKTS